MSRSWLKHFRRVVAVLGLLIVGCFFLAVSAEAANVQYCSKSGKSCVIKLESGIVGDRVKILDEKGRVIAKGRITKRKGAYAKVALNFKFKMIRKGYPVLVDIYHRGADHQWAASFGK